MEEQERNITKEEKTDEMPEMPKTPADEIPAEGTPDVPAADSVTDMLPYGSSEEVTEMLVPENTEISENHQQETPGRDEPSNASVSSGDTFEQSTTYVRADGTGENPEAAEFAPDEGVRADDESGQASGEYPSEYNGASGYESHNDRPHRIGAEKTGSGEYTGNRTDPGEKHNVRTDGRTEEYRDMRTAPYSEDPYKGAEERDPEWRQRASRTNDTNGKYESGREKGTGSERESSYWSSYDHYRFETPADDAPSGSGRPYSGDVKRSSSRDGKKKGKFGWIIAGIAAGTLIAAIFLFFGIRSLFINAVNTARSAPEAGAEAGAEAEAPTQEEPEIAIGNQDRKKESPQAAGKSDTETSEREGNMTVPEVVQMCLPSMVAITNTTVEEYRDYFGGTQTYENVSAGSGIIIGGTETELLIATNNHVIVNSTDITVTFIDDSVCPGTIKGQASDEDLAIISVNLSDISAETREQIAIVALGDSDDLMVGETVVAIGNALGYGQSVSKGVVSAMNRDVTVDGVTHTLIQTDASINPGNSGGALLNLRGELIGINEVKYVNTEVEGIGYAIPINVAEPILTNLGSRVQREKVSGEDRAYIGIKCVGVNSEYVQYGYPAGVYVSEVTPGGPADQAGLRTGDIITAIDGVPVSTTDQLLDNLEYYVAGETIDFSVSRQGETPGTFETTKIPITLGRRSESGLDDSGAGNGTAAPEDNAGNENPDNWGFPTLPE